MAGALLLLLKAALVGVAISAPPGPVGAVCIGRTLRRGLGAGLWSGLGAAVGDSLYALVVISGLTTLADAAREGRGLLALVVGPILLFAGFRVLRRAGRAASVAEETARDDDRVAKGRIAGMAGSAAFLTLGAPGTLPALFALFAALDMPGAAFAGPSGIALVAAGVLLGCMAWWVLLCGVVHRVRGHALRGLRLVDYAGGAFLVLAGVTALVAGLGALPTAV